MSIAAPALRALLERVVDYAGLFPPAALAMSPAVRRFAADRRSPDAWMLGRFVVPVARLEEFEAAALDLLPAGEDDVPWRLSAIVGEDVAAELARAAAFNARHAPETGAGRAIVDALEWRAPTIEALGAATAARARHLPGVALHVEVPGPGIDADAWARAAAADGLHLKLRTGGTTAGAFPSAGEVLAFLAAAVRHAVPVKLTAGLHHALGGEHALTYAPDSAHAPMFGFVNVLLAAALLRAGHAADVVAPLLEERDAGAFHFDAGATWRGLRVDTTTIAATRAETLLSFGSCAFDEPTRELRALGWWPA